MNSSGQKIRLEEIITIVEEKLKNGAAVTFSPDGVSMLPLIRPGQDSVTLSGTVKPRVGDAVFYKRPSGQFVLHRIVAKEEDAFVLSGDNQLALEKGVGEEWIIGIVTSVWRGKKELKRDGLFPAGRLDGDTVGFVLITDDGDFAHKIKKTAADVIKKLMGLGVVASVNQVIDFDTAALICEEFGVKYEKEIIISLAKKEEVQYEKTVSTHPRIGSVRRSVRGLQQHPRSH